jgi:DNA-binding SARP family transcriptional activator
MVGDSGRPADRLLTVDGDSVSVTPAGFTVTAVTIADEVTQLSALCETGAVDADLSPVPWNIVDESAAADFGHEGDPEVIVRVLGAVRVEGAADRFSRRIAEEVAVYLALHRRGVDEGRLKTALWPDTTPATSSFNQAVSRARVALGTNRAGEYHLPHITSEANYRVAASVTSDVEMLEGRLRSARLDPNEDTMVALAECIKEVDGLPFAGTGAGYEWAYGEGLIGWVQGLVSDAAHLLASWAITNGHASLALQATRSALQACPADEIIYRDQMLAHDLGGNPAGVEASMRELLAVIEAEVPQDAVHPETLALYERLCPRARDTSRAVS